MADKYNAVWVSHSSMGDYLKCPRAYFLHNVYKDPRTGRKINIVNPALALGSAVHEVVEGLAAYKVEDRVKKLQKESLQTTFEKIWKKVEGNRGGFLSHSEESEARDRAWKMIERVEKNPGPLLEKTIRIKNGENGLPPNFVLLPEENIILCGRIDWLVYHPEDDSVHILDFKTGRNEEDENSLQLPIYQLLLKNLQRRKVTGASYWYLDRDTAPRQVILPSIEDSFKRVTEISRAIKEAREHGEGSFRCPNGEDGCFACKPFEKIIRGEAQFIGMGEMRQDLYLVREK